MSFINHYTKQIHCKILYSGPLASGKTTNLRWISQQLKTKDKYENKNEQERSHEWNPQTKTEVPLPFQLPTHPRSTSLFDFLPLNVGKVHDFNVRFHLYTLPSHKRDEITKQVLLKGVDGLIFVADSQWDRLDSNLQSMKELQERLALQGMRLRDLPIILQYNKRDLSSIASLTDLRSYVNLYGFKEVEAEAHKGVGVISSLKLITKRLLAVLRGEELY